MISRIIRSMKIFNVNIFLLVAIYNN